LQGAACRYLLHLTPLSVAENTNRHSFSSP
jgi:hypothetical protein